MAGENLPFAKSWRQFSQNYSHVQQLMEFPNGCLLVYLRLSPIKPPVVVVIYPGVVGWITKTLSGKYRKPIYYQKCQKSKGMAIIHPEIHYILILLLQLPFSNLNKRKQTICLAFDIIIQKWKQLWLQSAIIHPTWIWRYNMIQLY